MRCGKLGRSLGRAKLAGSFRVVSSITWPLRKITWLTDVSRTENTRKAWQDLQAQQIYSQL